MKATVPAIIENRLRLISFSIEIGCAIVYDLGVVARQKNLPRLPIQVNWTLFAGCTALVLGFRSTEALAALYGLAVSGVMVVTSAAMIPVGTRYWGWTPLASGGLFGVFTLIDALFCIASSLKLLDGGYIPLGIGLAVFRRSFQSRQYAFVPRQLDRLIIGRSNPGKRHRGQ